MAHPKLGSVAQRSLLAATTAALIAGPLAVVGSAQTIEGLTDSAGELVDLTCKEAKATEDEELIEEFCDEPTDATDPEKTVKRAGDAVTKKVESTTSGGGGGGDGDGGSPAPTVENPAQPREQQPTGGSNMRPVSEGSGASDGRRPGAGPNGDASGASYDANGPVRPGMRSYSELTLQPFAQPLVSAPPIYELPRIAEQMFGSTTTTGAEDPLAAGATTATQASSYDGFAATAADPAGWLAATATGLIMLVGAAHALTGGRMPRRQRSRS